MAGVTPRHDGLRCEWRSLSGARFDRALVSAIDKNKYRLAMVRWCDGALANSYLLDAVEVLNFIGGPDASATVVFDGRGIRVGG
jgi:hypothetical protein